MERYLPAKTHVAFRRPDAETAEWFDTRKEIILPIDMEPATCPMRGASTRDRKFLTVDNNGYQIWFLADQAKYRMTADEIKAIANLQLYKLEYDISDAQVAATGMGHPATWMWRYGVRTSESVWVMPKGRIPYDRLNRFTEVGANWKCTKQDVSETPNEIDGIIKSLKKELDEAIQSARDSAETTAAAVRNQDASDDPKLTEEKIRKYAFDRAKTVERSYKAKLERLANGAGVFGFDLNRLNLNDVQITLEAVNTTMKQRARLFAKSVKTIAALGTTDGQAVAAALQNGQMEPAVAADYLEENNKAAEGQALRTAFGNEQNDGTFSLVGTDETEE